MEDVVLSLAVVKLESQGEVWFELLVTGDTMKVHDELRQDNFKWTPETHTWSREIHGHHTLDDLQVLPQTAGQYAHRPCPSR